MRLTERKGKRYTRLLVVDRAPNASSSDTNARWHCRCDCGRMVIAYGRDLETEKHKSCGCLNAARIYKHGMARTKIYHAWVQMRNRCNSPNNPSFHNYGGRGIFVDPAWEKFETFYADMGDCPKGMSLERKNNDGPYSKENCVWATAKVQHNNKRTNRFLTAFGKTQTFMQWSDEYGIPWTTIRARIERYGWPIEAAISRPQQQGIKLVK